jgi:hypothetical protein
MKGTPVFGLALAFVLGDLVRADGLAGRVLAHDQAVADPLRRDAAKEQQLARRPRQGRQQVAGGLDVQAAQVREARFSDRGDAAAAR